MKRRIRLSRAQRAAISARLVADNPIAILSAGECEPCPDCGEPWCAACDMHYADCPHPGPHSEP